MSTEPENEPTPSTTDPDPVVIEPEPTPEEETTPPPPPPPDDTMGTVVNVEPGTWYEVTSVCATTTCPNLNTSTTEPMVYSNAGAIRMVCGLCGQNRPILEVTKLDPQPEMS
jgi:hypothetical protein